MGHTLAVDYEDYVGWSTRQPSPLGSHILGEPSPFDPLPTPPKSPGLALLLAYPWWLDVLTGGLVSEVDFIAMELEALQAAPMAPRSPHAYFL